jgi:hypothetical protein
MILLQPISYDFTLANNMQWVGGSDPAATASWTKVTRGHPIAQQDGYLNNEWTRFDREYIFANFTHIPDIPTASDGNQHYNAGPPYLATISDWRTLAHSWTRLAPPVLFVFPKLFAEMYSFVWVSGKCIVCAKQQQQQDTSDAEWIMLTHALVLYVGDRV